MKKIYFIRIILGIWIYVWILFLVRPFFLQDLTGEYVHLLTSTREEKKSIVAGPDFYKFIQFCKSVLPPSSNYQIIGLDGESIEYRRSVYYLYPHRPKGHSEYLLVYKTKNYSQEGYAFKQALDDQTYILKQIRQ